MAKKLTSRRTITAVRSSRKGDKTRQRIIAQSAPLLNQKGYEGCSLQDIMAGQVDLMFDQAANSLPQVRGGKIRAYAVTAKSRLAAAPEIPTVDEAGLPEFYIAVWHGLWAPKGTPQEVTAKLSAAVFEALADPQIREKFAALGQEWLRLPYCFRRKLDSRKTCPSRATKRPAC